MLNIDDRLNKIRSEKQAELEAELKEAERDNAALQLCPDGFVAERTSFSGYNGVTVYRYTAKNAAEVLAIINAWRDKCGPFLSVNKYLNGCCVVSAYGYKGYTDETIKATAGDAVVARNSKGRGFDTQVFVFYPNVEGLRAEVSIDVEFRCKVSGFSGSIAANYDSYGNVTTVSKDEPRTFKKAGYVVAFGGGSRDSADWYGVFNYNALSDLLKEVT